MCLLPHGLLQLVVSNKGHSKIGLAHWKEHLIVLSNGQLRLFIVELVAVRLHSLPILWWTEETMVTSSSCLKARHTIKAPSSHHPSTADDFVDVLSFITDDVKRAHSMLSALWWELDMQRAQTLLDCTAREGGRRDITLSPYNCCHDYITLRCPLSCVRTIQGLGDLGHVTS